MLKKLLTVIFATAACATAAAAPQTFQFSYTGAWFNVQGPSTWRPDYQLQGSFRGEDVDHNGTIDQTEVEAFDVAGYSHCYPCEYSLSYNLSSKELKFNASYQFHEDPTYWGGGYFSEYGEGYSVGRNEHLSFNFSSDTVFAITVVPEPASYAMMGAGLLSLTFIQRRRKKTA